MNEPHIQKFKAQYIFSIILGTFTGIIKGVYNI